MVRSRRVGDDPPEPDDVFLIDADGEVRPGSGTKHDAAGSGHTAESGHAAGPGGASRDWSSSGRRVGIVLIAAAAFAFGVVVGRTSLGGSQAATTPAPTAGPSTTAAVTTRAPTAGPTRSASATAPAVTPPATASPSTATTARPATTPEAAESGGLLHNPALSGAVGNIFSGRRDVQALTVVDGDPVALFPGSIGKVSFDVAGRPAPNGRDVGLPIGDPTYADWHLLSDGRALWALAPGLRLYSIDPHTLTAQFLGRPRQGMSDAAAMDGHVFLTTNAGVYQEKPGADGALTATLVARGGRSMAADPSRHRLLILDHDDGWAVHAYVPPTAAVTARAALPFDARSIAVADGAIWVTGVSTGAGAHAVLARLDPATLTVDGHSDLGGALGSVPTIVAAGKSMWVRQAGDDEQLWCVTPGAGTVAQHWSTLPGLVAAAGGHAFVADGDVIGEIDLNHACSA